MIPIGILAAATPRAQGAWDPSRLTTAPKIWLNDDSPVTNVSGACSQWNDLTANGFHFAQATSGAMPQIIASGLNGRRVIRFDGTADNLSCSISAARDVMRNVQSGYAFAVLKKSALDGSDINRALLRFNTGAGAARFAVQVGSSITGANVPELGVRRLDGDSFAALGMGAALDTDFHILLITMDWGSRAGAIYLDGELVAANATLTATAGATSNTASNENPILGKDVAIGSRYLDCDLAELVVGSGSSLPSEAEIDKLFGYAAHRWDLAGNLPVGHPYKLAPPTL